MTARRHLATAARVTYPDACIAACLMPYMLASGLLTYISHRLASSKFCDRILLFADGRIAEQGSHEELMAADTVYRSLFQLQAQYYAEDV